ncbi:unnamed protein product [Zymoseptoria tritici ST99CH_3D1]|nr:unnamed protein product [Zymoseptoria tritici ST99CH_3D1]
MSADVDKRNAEIVSLCQQKAEDISNGGGEKKNREGEKKDREGEKKDREGEKKDREGEKKDREGEKKNRGGEKNDGPRKAITDPKRKRAEDDNNAARKPK